MNARKTHLLERLCLHNVQIVSFKFQARGLPHIHGVSWIAKDELMLREIDGDLMDNEVAALKLADDLVTCRVPQIDSGEEELRKIVTEVQTHGHTNSCRKYNGSCRYGYPKLPSPKTLLAKPLEQTGSKMNEEEISKKKKRATQVLSAAKSLLEDPDFDETMKLEDFYQIIGTDENEYVELLGISERGKVLILKRGLKERNINNYNEEMILAWNANMDIQLVVDPYAVISYIANYMNKDENSTTPFLRQALFENAGKETKEKLKALKEAYLTHRQVGASEAVYKVIPSMKLKDSNISCFFVNSGFPHKRSLFYKKIKEEYDDEYMPEEEEEYVDDSESEDEFEEQKPPPSKRFKIEGRPGTFEESMTVHKRYSNRPKYLEKMCLAQFAISYVPASKIPKRIVFKNGCSNEYAEQTIFKKDTQLPRYISLKNNLGSMRLRAFPAVLRMHNSNKKDGHEQEYSEMLLFSSWRNEIKDLCPDNEEECIEKHLTKVHEIEENRGAIYPGEGTINSLDNEDLEVQRPTHISDILDSQRQQENDDDLLVGPEDDPQFESFGHPDYLGQSSNVQFETSKYRKIHVPDDDEINHYTRRLVPEQMNILRKVVALCKDTVKSTKNIHHKVKQLLMIVHGGAGKKIL